jgi:Nucleotidyl transferase AbiEii toxin, Type IV TA system
MPRVFDPRLNILPTAQREIWEHLKPAPALSFVLYGGTAVALRYGHRQSVDFDFFRTEPLDKDDIRRAFAFVGRSEVIQDSPDTFATLAKMPSGSVRISFFGGIEFGRVNDPDQTRDGVLLVASPEDLLATKLKATQDRAEAKDYRDIAELLRGGVSLPRSLGAFKSMFKGEPAEVLRALGYFKDGDLPRLGEPDRELLGNARDRVRDVPIVPLIARTLAGP